MVHVSKISLQLVGQGRLGGRNAPQVSFLEHMQESGQSVLDICRNRPSLKWENCVSMMGIALSNEEPFTYMGSGGYEASIFQNEEKDLLPEVGKRGRSHQDAVREEGGKRAKKGKEVKEYTRIPVDDKGAIQFPISLKGLQVLCLGKVNFQDPNFHSKKYIWPIGFKTQRFYFNREGEEGKCLYTNEIIQDNGEIRFKVSSEDPKDIPVIKSTASGAWAVIGKRTAGAQDVARRLSGPEMFGLTNPTVAKMIQDLPGANLCAKYERQQFILVQRTDAGQKKSSNVVMNDPLLAHSARDDATVARERSRGASMGGHQPRLPLGQSRLLQGNSSDSKKGTAMRESTEYSLIWVPLQESSSLRWPARYVTYQEGTLSRPPLAMLFSPVSFLLSNIAQVSGLLLLHGCLHQRSYSL